MTRSIRRPKSMGLRMAEESAAANAKLELQGLHLPPRPDDERVPRLADVGDLTDVDDTSLMDFFERLTSWAGFLASQLACAQVDERAAQEVLTVAEAEAMVRDWGGTSKDRVTVAKAERAMDEHVQAQQAELREAYAYRKLVDVLYSNVDRDSAVVSREITRRTSGADPKTRRSERWSR